MKCIKLWVVLVLTAVIMAGNASAQGTVKKDDISHVERDPEFPGGSSQFNKYITRKLKYPEVAMLLGLSGNVVVSFVVEGDGTVTNVAPLNCLGAGCESEAARVISSSPKWNPGIMDGKSVRVQYSVQVGFKMDSSINVYMTTLKRSDYGFVFYINQETYTINEAETILGKFFSPSRIGTVENDDDTKYAMPDKKGVYLVVMKNN